MRLELETVEQQNSSLFVVSEPAGARSEKGKAASNYIQPFHISARVNPIKKDRTRARDAKCRVIDITKKPSRAFSSLANEAS